MYITSSASVGVDQGLILESGLDMERAVLDEDVGVITSCLFESVVAVHTSVITTKIDKYCQDRIPKPANFNFNFFHPHIWI